MDDLPPSDCDYTKQVAAQNNMNIMADNTPLSAGPQKYDFAMPPLQTPRASHKDALNELSPADNFNTSLELSPPMVIPYSANVPADPSLWDGNFTATSLFGTNEFLQSDVRNMACSLQCIACFLKQQSLEGRDGNNIPQLELFGKSAWCSYPRSLNLAGTSSIHPKTPLSVTTSLPMLEICKPVIGPLRTMPTLKRQRQRKPHHLSHPASPKNK